MEQHDSKDKDSGKASYSVADRRSPQQRERDLLRAARAEGRPQPADGSRPLSAAHAGRGKEQGSAAPAPDAGPSTDMGGQETEDPGARARANAPVKSRP
jgi:hypothetical protein